MAEKAKDEAISKATEGILSGLPPGGMDIYRIYNYPLVGYVSAQIIPLLVPSCIFNKF